MASQHPRGSLSPRFPADYIAPTSDRVARPYTTNLNTAHYISVHSHMSPASLHMPSINPHPGNAGYRREPRPTAEDNTQPRFELFLLGEGEKKVTEEADTRKFSNLSSSKPADTCYFYTNSPISRRSPLSMTDSEDILLVPIRLHLTSLRKFSKRFFPLLIHDASSIQVSPHHRSSPSTRKITLSEIFSARDFYNRYTSDLPATKCPIHLSGKSIPTRFFRYQTFPLTLLLTSKFELRVQTDGTLTPRAALIQCCKDLVNDLSILSREFTKEFELRKMVGDGSKADEKKDDKRAGK